MEYFIAVDGDDVGRRLEYYMLMNDVSMLRRFSIDFADCMFWFRDFLVNEFAADIVFFGGDNLLARIIFAEDIKNAIDLLRGDFQRRSSSTISIGIGFTPRDAYFSLKIAKATGKNMTYFLQEGEA